jgi:hypothetical protein
MPFHVRSSRVADGIVTGWQLTGILTLQEGQPFTVYIGKDASNTGGGSDRPNVIGDWRVTTPDPAAFSIPARWRPTASRALRASPASPPPGK